MPEREESLIQKLYFIRSMIDIVLQSVPEDKRNKILNKALLQKIDDNYVDLTIALADYDAICAELDEAENQDIIRQENNQQAFLDFGENFNTLVNTVNDTMKHEDESIGVYIGRKKDGHTFLQVIDEIKQQILRTYEDNYDLAINLNKDLATKFKCKKTDFNNIKKIDLKNKKNNKE